MCKCGVDSLAWFGIAVCAVAIVCLVVYSLGLVS